MCDVFFRFLDIYMFGLSSTTRVQLLRQFIWPPSPFPLRTLVGTLSRMSNVEGKDEQIVVLLCCGVCSSKFQQNCLHEWHIEERQWPDYELQPWLPHWAEMSWGNHRKAIANQCPCGPVDPLQRAWALSRVALCRRVLRPRETHWPRGPGVKTGLPVSPTRRVTRTTWGMAPTTHYQLPSGRRMRAMLSGIASWVQPLWLNPNLKDECGCILWIRWQ